MTTITGRVLAYTHNHVLGSLSHFMFNILHVHVIAGNKKRGVLGDVPIRGVKGEPRRRHGRHGPLTPGRHELYVRTFRPLASSLFGRFQSWLMGARPEFRDTHFPSKGEGRDVTRVQSYGCVKLVCDVTLQGMEELGYAVPPPQRPSVRLAAEVL